MCVYMGNMKRCAKVDLHCTLCVRIYHTESTVMTVRMYEFTESTSLYVRIYRINIIVCTNLQNQHHCMYEFTTQNQQ